MIEFLVILCWFFALYYWTFNRVVIAIMSKVLR